MSALIWIPTALVVAVLMDLWAALLHGRVWHQWLWFVHQSHHVRRHGHFEANDVLSTLHAPLAIALILYGCVGPVGVVREVVFGVGIGASIFGVAYLMVHDGLVHRRLPVRWLRKLPYIRAVEKAHNVHHSDRGDGVPYGFFFGPLELKRHARRSARASGSSARQRAAPTRASHPTKHYDGAER